MNKDETEFFIRGAKYFEKDYDSLSNKRQYKEEYYLNTGLSMFRKKSKILIFTSCISETNYLYRVVTKDVYNVVIYYFRSMVNIKELKDHYLNSKVKFIQIHKNPKDEFSHSHFHHNTVVFAGDDTIIFDSKELGYEGNDNENNRNVYRDKSKRDYNECLERAKRLI